MISNGSIYFTFQYFSTETPKSFELKGLNIIKYNENLKKRININTDDYKEYSEKYSPIEIEIIPKKNEYGKFINIKKEDKKYYHIYFNNNGEEIKKNNIEYHEDIKIIKVVIDYQVESFEILFKGCYCIESICFKKFHRKNIINMRCMFERCRSLKELNINNFNTNNVNDMSWMFYRCKSLTELNLNNFNTNNITDMSCMFFQCSSLKD